MPRLTTLTAAILLTALSLRAAELPVAENARVAFLGDSITQYGWSHPTGYVQLVAAAFEANDVPIVPIPAGISGHKSNQMLARLEKDVLSRKADWLILSCGVNDVWHGARGVDLPAYRENITSIVDQAQAADIQVVILTATMIKEEPDNELNAKLAPYNDFLRQLAAEKNCRLADASADMIAAVTARRAELGDAYSHQFTNDGVHMNGHGNALMATAVLRALGFDDAMLATARAAWLQMPSALVDRRHPYPVRFETQLDVERLSAEQEKAFKERAADRIMATMAELYTEIEGQNATPPAAE